MRRILLPTALAGALALGGVTLSATRSSPSSTASSSPSPSLPAGVLRVASSSRPGGPLTSQSGLVWSGSAWMGVATLRGQVTAITWTDPPSTVKLGQGRDPTIYIGEDGAPWVAYVTRAGDLVVHRWSGMSWWAAETVTTGLGAGGALPDGCGPWLAWVDSPAQGQPGELHIGHRGSGTWSTALAASSATAPSLDCTPVLQEPRLAVSIRDAGGGGRVEVQDGSSGTWQPLATLGASGWAFDPSLSLCHDGSTYVGYHDGAARSWSAVLDQAGGTAVQAASTKYSKYVSTACADGLRVTARGEWPTAGEAQAAASSRTLAALVERWDGTSWIATPWSPAGATTTGVGPASVAVHAPEVVVQWIANDGVYFARTTP